MDGHKRTSKNFSIVEDQGAEGAGTVGDRSTNNVHNDQLNVTNFFEEVLEKSYPKKNIE